MPEFLDLTHRYTLMCSDPENHERINQRLTGPLTTDPPRPVDERAGFAPPSWWKGDDYASRSGQLAALALRR